MANVVGGGRNEGKDLDFSEEKMNRKSIFVPLFRRVRSRLTFSGADVSHC